MDHLAREPVEERIRILSLSTQYFRGFREPECPINLGANLLVIHGPNSTGKTSLTEALEWVLTGRLSRRESGFGHPRELENCITNEFCPSGTRPFVEIELAVDGERHSFRRELLEDYGSTQRSIPKTVAYLDGEELSAAADGSERRCSAESHAKIGRRHEDRAA